jgi:hypothetical protein
MKYLAAILALVVWGLLTLALVVSVLGIAVLLIAAEESEWFKIPEKLVKVFE